MSATEQSLEGMHRELARAFAAHDLAQKAGAEDLLAGVVLVGEVDLRVEGVPLFGSIEVLNEKQIRVPLGRLLVGLDRGKAGGAKINLSGLAGLVDAIRQLVALIQGIKGAGGQGGGAGVEQPGGPPAAPPPGPAAPPIERLLYPSGVRIAINRIFRGPGDTHEDFLFHMEGNKVVLDVETDEPGGGRMTNLPLQSGVSFAAEYLDAEGKPFKFEEQTPPALHLYNTARWTVTTERGRVDVAPPYTSTFIVGQKPANFRLDLLEEYNGMDGVLHFPPEDNDLVPVLGLTVFTPQGPRAYAVEFPKVS